MTLQERERRANEILNAALTQIAQECGLLFQFDTTVKKYGSQLQIEPGMRYDAISTWNAPSDSKNGEQDSPRAA